MATRKKTVRHVFHHSLSTSASPADIQAWHMARGITAPGGYHWLIRRDGSCHSIRDLSAVGAHARGKNYDSVGTCIAGDFRREEPTVAQIQAAMSLHARMCERYGRSLNVEFHRSAVEGNPCPGLMLDRHDWLEQMRKADPYWGFDQG